MRALLSLILWLIPLAALAEPAPLAAVGVIRIGDGPSGCTGTLIEPDLVLTAGHCLGHPVEALSFRPGRSAGQPLPAPIPVVARAQHPVFAMGLGAQAWRARYDLGLVRLARPVPDDIAHPLPVGGDPVPDAPLFMASFRGAAGDAARQRRCAPLDVEPGQLFLACEVRQGESGAPIYSRSDDGPVVLGIVTTARRILRQPVAAGPMVDIALPGTRDALAAAEKAR